jgi:recombination protein RecR
MPSLAAPIEAAIVALSRLPGIGRKTAQRLTFHLLKVPAEEVAALARSLVELREKVRLCSQCFNLADGDLCPICADPRRERSLLCVVEEPSNLSIIERTGVFRGIYHVLGGAIAPMKNIGPDDLRFRELVDRIHREAFREIVLALNPNVEGEATAVYISRLLKPLGVSLSRLAQGLPAGADLEFTDDLTLTRAFEGRKTF